MLMVPIKYWFDPVYFLFIVLIKYCNNCICGFSGCQTKSLQFTPSKNIFYMGQSYQFIMASLLIIEMANVVRQLY